MKHQSRYAISLAILMAAHTSLVAAATVTPPPLPRGSEKVQPFAGQNPKETKRDKHAHKRLLKDKTLDDTRTTARTSTPTASTAPTITTK